MKGLNVVEMIVVELAALYKPYIVTARPFRAGPTRETTANVYQLYYVRLTRYNQPTRLRLRASRSPSGPFKGSLAEPYDTDIT